MKPEFTIQPYSKEQLAQLYGCSLRILRSWLKPIHAQIGIYNGKTYTPKQVLIIINHIGEP